MDELRKQSTPSQGGPASSQGGPASSQGGPPPSNIPSLPDSSDESTHPATPPLGELPRSPQPPRQEIRQQPQPFRPEQKSVYLERGEVRGMGKDIARVREEEARIEQQRIAALKTHKETEEERKTVERIRAAALSTKQQEETQRKKEFKNIRDSILPPGEERRIRELPSPPSS